MDVASEPLLVAYVNPEDAASGKTWSIIQEDLKETIPSYMLPRVAVGIETWPRTSSGKIDR